MYLLKATRHFIGFCLILTGSAAKGQEIWDIKDLYHVPEYEWTGNQTAPVRSLIYKGEAFGDLARTDVFAYYATPGTLSGHPEKDKNLPAIVLVHGGMGKAYMEWAKLWAERGYAAIAMDLAGNGPDGKRLENGGPKEDNIAKFNSIEGDLNKQWVYHAVANVIKAHSLIRSFAGVDSAKTAITGISWGGFLTCIVSGLDQRFKVSVPVYGCGFIYHPDGVFYRNIQTLRPDLQEKWIRQYDPSNFIARAKIPFLWVSGAKDFAYQPTIMAKTYNLVKDQSNFRFIPDMHHDQEDGAAPEEIATFINQHLLKTYLLPVINNIKAENGRVEATILNATKINSGALFYTEDTFLPYKDRRWKELPAVVTNKKIIADTLPERAVMWMLNVKDDKGNTVSSPYMFRKPKIVDTLLSERFISRYGDLNNTYYHIKNTKQLTVGFLGGSITEMAGWRDKVCNYLRTTYPDVKFNFIAAAIPSLGSVAHSFRLKTDLFGKGKTDLLFLESAVNDKGTKESTQRRALEGIVRAVLTENPATDIVMMAFADKGKMAEYNVGKTPLEITVHDAVAKRYQLPFINLAKEVTNRINNGEFTWENDFKNLHPSPFGHQLYFNTIRQLLTVDDPVSALKLAKRRIEEPMDAFNYGNADYVSIRKARLLKGFNVVANWQPADGVDTRTGFVNVPVLLGEKPGDNFEFTFTGNTVGIGTITGPDVGIISYSIDDRPVKTVDLFIPAAKKIHHPYYLILGDELNQGKHTLKIKIDTTHNDNSMGNACRIVYFLVNQKEGIK